MEDKMEEKQEEEGGGPCVLFLHAFGREGFAFLLDNNLLPSKFLFDFSMPL